MQDINHHFDQQTQFSKKDTSIDTPGLKLFLFPGLKVPRFNDQELTYLNVKVFPKIFSITATDKTILT